MNILAEKTREVLYAVLPITILVLLLHLTLAPLETMMLVRFCLGALLIILGLTVFLVGVDVGITPVGNVLGAGIARSNKVLVVALAGLLLGFFVSIAEPDLHILAGQVDTVTGGAIAKNSLVIIVSLGIAFMLALGLVRIVFNLSLRVVLLILYGIILVLALLTSPELLAISFDASGATTGALTVPFILALAIGVSKLKKDSLSSEEDSFGLVAIASTGAIIGVMLMSIFTRTGGLSGDLAMAAPDTDSLWMPFITILPTMAMEVTAALMPLLLIFLLYQGLTRKLSGSATRKILFGMLFTFIGLVIFLLGVNAGFMQVGSEIGHQLASRDNKAGVVIVGFILGMVTILAEPAVYVLTHQIEDVTSGYVKRRIVLLTLAVGVALAVALSMIRILTPGLELWYYLLPGYLISIGLMYIVPDLFVGIAFDSGGVASGPMTATFILAYAQGAAAAVEGADVLTDGFGLIAMVAMTPLIALQLLGFVFKLKARKRADVYGK